MHAQSVCNVRQSVLIHCQRQGIYCTIHQHQMHPLHRHCGILSYHQICDSLSVYVHMCVRVYVLVYVCIRICLCDCILWGQCMCMCSGRCEMYMFVYMYIYMYMHRYMYRCRYTCMYMYTEDVSRAMLKLPSLCTITNQNEQRLNVGRSCGWLHGKGLAGSFALSVDICRCWTIA